jgi:outer membrane immunogenic protein
LLNGVGFIGAAVWIPLYRGASTPVPCFGGNVSQTNAGWTAGAGVEWAPWSSNVVVTVDYLYVIFGGNTVNVVAFNQNGGANLSSISTVYNGGGFNLVRGGLNWKF